MGREEPGELRKDKKPWDVEQGPGGERRENEAAKARTQEATTSGGLAFYSEGDEKLLEGQSSREIGLTYCFLLFIFWSLADR